MKTFQRRVADFVDEHKLDADVAHRLLDAMSEFGEVAKEALKASRYGSTTFSPTRDWADELGDLLFSVICVANKTGVDLEDALDRALKKYEERIRQRGEAASYPDPTKV